MKVFKFGGASVKDAESVKNVSKIISMFPHEKIGVIVSAMDKTTNAMEGIVDAYLGGDKQLFEECVEERRAFHLSILSDLFSSKNFEIESWVNETFDELKARLSKSPAENKDFEYDQIVCIGELLSCRILTAYLASEGHQVQFSDARKLIRTDHTYREGKVDWGKTQALFKEGYLPNFSSCQVQITQGFIGHNAEGFTTTLGREGSDYSAAIIAYCCEADNVTIWKDVPGMLNADPKWFDNTQKLDGISFKEAIELSYYGASVIHPKTIQPLQNKGISLFVKSFIEPEKEGTIISANDEKDHLIPSFIFKMEQLKISITPKDFSFLVEENLGDILTRLSQLNVKINVMQNSALSFSIIVDEQKTNIEALLQSFQEKYDVEYQRDLELVTIRHYDDATINRVCNGKKVLMEQRMERTARFVLQNVNAL